MFHLKSQANLSASRLQSSTHQPFDELPWLILVHIDLNFIESQLFKLLRNLNFIDLNHLIFSAPRQTPLVTFDKVVAIIVHLSPNPIKSQPLNFTKNLEKKSNFLNNIFLIGLKVDLMVVIAFFNTTISTSSFLI